MHPSSKSVDRSDKLWGYVHLSRETTREVRRFLENYSNCLKDCTAWIFSSASIPMFVLQIETTNQFCFLHICEHGAFQNFLTVKCCSFQFDVSDLLCHLGTEIDCQLRICIEKRNEQLEVLFA